MALEQELLDMFEDHPEIIIRHIANTLHVCKKVIEEFLRNHQLYPNYIQQVKVLLPRDFPHEVLAYLLDNT